MVALLLVLSFIVSLDVFWTLRQPGLTLAGDADCKITEHTHDSTCISATNCPFIEHIHTINCYSNDEADVETQIDWYKMFSDFPYSGNLRTDLVGIAKTQVGYSESELNFEIRNGTRNGYTRYGAWYGDPYSDWSAMFVSFCLHYAGADKNEFPLNTGASSMATLWAALGKFTSENTYKPLPGDLVFFTDNTVGIVADVQTTTAYVIRGDVDNAVRNDVVVITDSSITGWGITGEIEEPEKSEDQLDTSDVPEISDPLDISDGPKFIITEGEEVHMKQMLHFSLKATRSITDLISYLEENGGSYFFTLLDKNNEELPKDEQGNYIAQTNTEYKIILTFNSPDGFHPGTYQYQVPNGLMVDGGEGTFILNEELNVGSWVVTDTGLITLDFNEHINSHTNITLSATLGIHFPEQEDPIDFDGKISVSVEKPPPQTNPTIVNKWGNQGGIEGSNGTDPGKIYWGLEIIGNKDSQIPDSILTDSVIDGQWSKTHRYTESDIAGGLSIGVGENGNWHNFHVSADDPRLIWTETGWSYKMPKTAVCQWCGEIELGSDGWYYYIDFTSTPEPVGTAGTFGYENEATIDGAYGYAWVNFTHGEITGEIVKSGSLTSDAENGSYIWEFQATIPGRTEGKPAEYHWYIMDTMKVLDNNGQPIAPTHNDAHLSTVTATYNGTTFTVPRIQDATANDFFAWDNGWSSTENGVTNGREFNLLCRCQCTPETCHWGGSCGEYWYLKDDGSYATNGFCQCWTVTENITFTFVYQTDVIPVVEDYGGLDYQVLNIAELFYIPDGAAGGASVSRAETVLPIPGIFKKELTHDFNGYTANYKVTINEAKIVLTDGSPLKIHDVMTNTLAYISGSLVITAEDIAGNITTLRQGTDYTVTYDGTGSQKDENGKEVHVLDITILHPQQVMYTLDYDATLVLPPVVTGGIKYTNSATITLWGEDLKEDSAEKVHADINIAAKSYKLELFKISELTGLPLGGAEFGLYNAQGGLITSDISASNGQILFQTSIVEGIILREHILYYVQELRAPTGYQLDNTQFWFCFCDSTGDYCETCNNILAGSTATNAVRIPFEQSGKLHITNQLMNYDLPATGGFGIYPLILVSVLFIATPLVYRFIRRCKREGRGVG